VSRLRVCSVAELPPGGVAVVTRGRTGVAVFNVGGRHYALNNSCPHMGAPLAAGVVSGTTRIGTGYRVEWVRDGEILACPWHRWEIELATGCTLVEPYQRVPTYPVTVENDDVYIEVGS
jgi:nitrite reductase/ring-hydroxylating ferredoxin subunit